MSRPKAYIRPMNGWWLKKSFYVRYMIRESTSVFVTIYATILLAGLASLKAGESAYNGWLEAMTHPLALSFHLLALAAALYHTVTWFKVAPKVMPMMFIGSKKVADITITLVQYVVAIVTYLLLFVIIWRV